METAMQNATEPSGPPTEIRRHDDGTKIGVLPYSDAADVARYLTMRGIVCVTLLVEHVPQYTLDDEAIDLEEFFRDNDESLSLRDVANIRKMEVLAELTFGGGGCPMFVLKRIA